MNTTSILTTVALVLTTGGGLARVDSGFVDGLRPGDVGQAYYELSVAGQSRRVEVAEVEVVSVTDAESVIAAGAEVELRAGFLVEFEVPAQRISFSEVLSYARRAAELEGTTVDDSLFERLIPEDPALEALMLDWLMDGGHARLQPSAPGPAPRAEDQVLLVGGPHTIGLSAAEARFYNHQPKFEVRVDTLLVDRAVVTVAEFRRFRPNYPFSSGKTVAVGIPFELAGEYCRWRGARVPTEFEWEVAVDQTGVALTRGLLEWTDSWYAPYPGNTRPEEAYGESFKVLRGGFRNEQPDPHRRRFMDPEATSQEVGFRCVAPVTNRRR